METTWTTFAAASAGGAMTVAPSERFADAMATTNFLTNYKEAQSLARELGVPILLYYGQRDTCGFCRYLEDQVFSTDRFQGYMYSNSVVLLKNVSVPGVSYGGTPSCFLLDADLNILSSRIGFSYNSGDAWMNWFGAHVTLKTNSSKIDLAPDTPSGWNDSLLIATAAGTVTEPELWKDTDTLFVGFGVRNTGTERAGAFKAEIRVDGVAVRTVDVAALTAGASTRITGIDIGKLGVGIHTVQVVLDSTAAVAESLEGNNRHTREILICPANSDRQLLTSTRYLNGGTVANRLLMIGGGFLWVRSGSVARDMEMRDGGSMFVDANARAESPIVRSGGYLQIASGGSVREIAMFGGKVWANAGAAIDSAVLSGGELDWYGSVAHLTVSAGGVAYMLSGAELNSAVIESGGKLLAQYGAKEVRSARILAGGSAQFGYCCNAGLVVRDTVVEEGARVTAESSIIMYDTAVQGTLYAYQGEVRNLTVASGGSVYLSSETVFGKLSLAGSANVMSNTSLNGLTELNLALYRQSGAVLNAPGGTALSAQLSISIDVANAWGDYTGISNVAGDLGNAKIKAVSGGGSATVTVGGNTVTLGDGKIVALRLSGQNLLISVGGTDTVAPGQPGNIVGAVTGKNTFAVSWDRVADFSGVEYQLEYAKNAAFDNAYRRTELGNSASIAMPAGNWYWRVRAIDGAGNASAWNRTGNFTIDWVEKLQGEYLKPVTLDCDVELAAGTSVYAASYRALALQGSGFTVRLAGPGIAVQCAYDYGACGISTSDVTLECREAENPTITASTGTGYSAYAVRATGTLTVNGELSGTVAASGKYAYGLYGCGLNATVTGTLFAGAETDLDTLLAKLGDFATHRTELLALSKSAASHFAAYCTSQNTADLTLGAEARVIGDVFLGGAGSTLTIDGNAELYGNISGNRAHAVTIRLDKKSLTGTRIVTDAWSTRTSLQIDASSASRNGTYTLVEGSLPDRNITLTVGGTAQALTVGGAVAVGGVTYRLTRNSGGDAAQLQLTVSGVQNHLASPKVTVDTRAPTNRTVTLTAVFDPECVVFQYSTDGADWRNFTGELTVSANGTWHFRGLDGDGAASPVAVHTVGNIDKVAPDAPVPTADVTAPTNRDVTLCVAANSDFAQLEYKIGSGEWQSCDGLCVTVTENATVCFRAFDLAGNVSEAVCYSVRNIDKIAPDAPRITPSSTAPTNASVTLCAAANPDFATLQYRLNDGDWQSCAGLCVEATENGIYCFRAWDAAGNVSDAVCYTVGNIDRTIPDAPQITVSTVEPTNSDVTLCVVANPDFVAVEYKIGSGEWRDCGGLCVTVTENATVCFRAFDSVGNVSETICCTVENIDKTPPSAPVPTANVTGPTNRDVTLCVADDPDFVQLEYKIGSGEWQSCDGLCVTVTENATVCFRAFDLAGNVSEAVCYSVGNIDRIAPDAPRITPGSTAPTNANVTLCMQDNPDFATLQYRLNDGDWQSCDGLCVEATENGIYCFRAWDAAGNVSDAVCYTVGNIDRTPPDAPQITVSTAEPTNSDVTLCVADDPDFAQLEYQIGSGAWQSCDGLCVTVTENATVCFRAFDSAGNASDAVCCTVGNIDKVAPDAPQITRVGGSRTNTVFAVFAADATVCEYSLDGKEWALYQAAAGIAIGESTTLYFRSTDAAGNRSVRSYNAEFSATYTEGETIARAGIPATGELGYNGNLSDVWTFIPELGGRYRLDGNFRILNGSATIRNGRKTVASGTVRDGWLVFNKGKSVLLEGGTVYTIELKSTDKGKRASQYEITPLADELFPLANQAKDDDWPTAPAFEPNVAEWVGYGDATDFRSFATAADGFVRFSLADVENPVKLTVYECVGNRLKTIRSVTATTKTGGAASTGELVLSAAKQYAVKVTATGAAKGLNSGYTLTAVECGAFDRTNNLRSVATALENETVRRGTVTRSSGGDKVDWLDLTAWEGLQIELTAGKVKLSFYDEAGKLRKISGVTDATGGTLKPNQAALSLSASATRTNAMCVAELDDAIRLVKVEALASGVCDYTLARVG